MSKGRSTIYRGAAGRAKADEELAMQKKQAEARKAQGHQPFRFKVGVGETTQFIILDEAPDVYRYEHALQDPKTKWWNIFTGCVKEFDNCPVCEATRDSYYALYLTVIDLTEFTTRDGDTVEFSRKLLVVKPGQQKKFNRLYTRAIKDGGSLRGALIEVSRDGEKDASIGSDFELVEYVEEEELQTYVRKWKDRDGKKQVEKCYEVLDYEKLFGDVTTESLRKIVGGNPAPGSRAHEERELGSRRPSRKSRDEEPEDEDDDDEGYSSPAKRERMAGNKKRPTGRGRDEDDEDGDDEDEDKPTRPRRARRDEDDEDTPKAPRRAASRRGRDEEEDSDADGDDEAEDEEDSRPARRGRSAAAKPAAKARAKSRDDDEDEADESDEDDPPRKAPGVGRRGRR